MFVYLELLFNSAIHILVILTLVFNTVWSDPVSVCGYRKIVRKFDKEEGKVGLGMLMTACRVVLDVLVGFMED